MKHTYFPLAAVALLAGWMALSCNFKKIELDGFCFEHFIIDCTETGGTLFAFETTCSADSPESVQWQVEGDPAVLTGDSVAYLFADATRSYSVTVTATTGGKTTEKVFTVDASDTEGLKFEKRLDQPDSQTAEDIAAMPDGYAICGANEDDPANPTVTRAFVTRTDKRGNVLWHRTIEPAGATYSIAHGIVANPDGSVAIAGKAVVGNMFKIYVAKLNPDGTTAINKTLDDPMVEQKGFSIDRFPATGEYLICGHRYDNSQTGGQAFVQRLNGNMAISGFPTLLGNAGAHMVKAVGASGFLVAGSRYIPFDNNPSTAFPPIFHVSKWNSSSTVASWQTPNPQFNQTTERREGYSVVQLSNFTVVACGDSRQTATSKPQVRLEYFSTGGVRFKFLPFAEGTVAFDLVEATGSGGSSVVLACRSSEGTGSDPSQDGFLVMSVSLSSGNVNWTKKIDLPGVQNDAIAISKSADCGYIVAGRTAEGGGRSTVLVRIDPNGH